jgi:hypothetical protein
LALLWLPTVARSQVALERDGNIFLRDGGHEQQLTFSHSDHQPFLAVGCASVFFVHDLEPPQDPKFTSDHTEIWSTSMRSPGTAKPVYRGPFRWGRVAFTEFWHPEASGDCRQVYFMTNFAAVTPAVVRFDRTTDTVSLVVACLHYSVLSAGQFRDDLLIQQRRSAGPVGYDEIWLVVTSDGKEIKVFGKQRPPEADASE